MSGQHRPQPLPVNESTRLGYNPDQQQSYPPQSTGYNAGAGPAGRHNPMSSRDSYPTFLSIGESIKLQLRWAWCGLWDAFRWNVVWRVLASDPEIRANVLKSFMLNSLSLISIYTFELVLQPLVRDQERWLHRNLGWFYHVMWLLPVLGMAFYLNSSWCTLIARRTFTLQYGSRVSASTAAAPPGYTGMLKQLATSAYRVVMVFTSLLVSFSLGIIPYVGPLCGFVFFCWIDAYYCFEFVWIARGMSLSRRVRHLEERWAYYLAFGLPATAICMLGTGLASAALFALVYPTYIILAMHASPKPLDPYNPTSSEHSSSSIRHPSPFIPIRVPVFGLVIWLNDAIVRVLSVGSSPTNSAPGMMGLASPQGKKMGYGRGRALSDVADSVEEGGQWEAVPLTPAPGMSMGQAGSEMQMQQQQQPVRQAKTRERVMLSRRKAD